MKFIATALLTLAIIATPSVAFADATGGTFGYGPPVPPPTSVPPPCHHDGRSHHCHHGLGGLARAIKDLNQYPDGPARFADAR